MPAEDLQEGFLLGEWLVQPRDLRITGQAGTFAVPSAHMQVLLALAEHPGEVVSRQALRNRAFAGQPHADEKLREAIGALHAALGDSARHPRYIAAVGHDGYALIAHFERAHTTTASGTPTVSAGGRLQRLFVELRRRHVFRVAASYLLVIWITLQVAEVTFAPLHFPPWWMTALTILAIVGLPIVVVLAWAYEITPGGIVRDPADAAAIRLPRARRAIAPAIVAGVAAMAGVTGFAWWKSLDTAAGNAALPSQVAEASIAVLPLVDMSPATNEAYLGDGLSEELSTQLAQVPGLRVAARTSAFAFKGKSMDVRLIGQRLGVRHVLEGSVRRAGDSLRVTVQLIDASNGYHVWAGSYDRAFRDIIPIQDEIARAVTAALKVVLTPGKAATAEQRPAPDIRAYDAYLAGLALLRNSGDNGDVRRAIERFDAALALDPAFARAHAGRCSALIRQFDRTHDRAGLAEAEQSCKRALDLDPALVETEKALAALYVTGGRFATAESMYRGLVARLPRDADGYIGLGEALDGERRVVEAERAMREATVVEPSYWKAHNALGTFLFHKGRIDEAAASYRRVADLTPASASAYNNLGAALQMKGDLAGSADAFEKSLRLEPSRAAYSNLGTVYYYLGQYPQAAERYAKAAALAGQDQSMWGNLADALWQIPARRAQAMDCYRRAVALATAELAAHPDSPVINAQLGYYHGRLGDRERSRDYLARAQASASADIFVLYYAAVAAADRGDLPEARRNAAAARDRGYPGSLLAADPSLAKLGLAKGPSAGG